MFDLFFILLLARIRFQFFGCLLHLNVQVQLRVVFPNKYERIFEFQHLLGGLRNKERVLRILLNLNLELVQCDGRKFLKFFLHTLHHRLGLLYSLTNHWLVDRLTDRKIGIDDFDHIVAVFKNQSGDSRNFGHQFCFRFRLSSINLKAKYFRIILNKTSLGSTY